MGFGKEYKRTEYRIESSKIRNEVKLILLTDMHGKVFSEENKKFTEALKTEKPDAILIAGDMILAKKKSYEESRRTTKKLLESLSGTCPVYYGNGNHETKVKLRTEDYGNAGKTYQTELGKYCTFLPNSSIFCNLKENRLKISGLETDISYYKKWGKLSMENSYLEELLGKGEQDEFHILLAHNPHYFDTYARWGADLILSGHLHGGVVGFPGCGGIISPQFKLFPKYTAGIFKKNGRHLIVSRGLGEHLPPVRIANPREYVVIYLCPEK